MIAWAMRFFGSGVKTQDNAQGIRKESKQNRESRNSKS